jgi:hypothetical protein
MPCELDLLTEGAERLAKDARLVRVQLQTKLGKALSQRFAHCPRVLLVLKGHHQTGR